MKLDQPEKWSIHIRACIHPDLQPVDIHTRHHTTAAFMHASPRATDGLLWDMPLSMSRLDGGWHLDVNLAHTAIFLYISIYIYIYWTGQGRRRGSVRQAGRQAEGGPGSSSWPCRLVQLREFNSMLVSRARIDVYHRHLASSREGCEMEDRLADRAGKAGQKISERNPKAPYSTKRLSIPSIAIHNPSDSASLPLGTCTCVSTGSSPCSSQHLGEFSEENCEISLPWD
ncbi:hypothetical protein TEQG_06215 [Trichophyton equinum CBS 127.97]|uniref:Uncharacterized protein n=1 Tax=Trichophyton equinum (strain ATCC MYA-4606 / CBS 127.97) TaxID=559882 RepID=F2PZI8_TRIEC|nr:hypothetical protein TEQG_06215 [Trichophyton equinum CBS 127.97]